MKKIFTLLPLLVSCLFFANAQEALPESYLVYESNSCRVLYSHNAELKRPISSLAQIATGLVALDWVERTRVDLGHIVTVPQGVQAIPVGNPMNLQPGSRITLRDAIYATLLAPDSAAAYTVAHFVGSDLAARKGGGNPVELFMAEANKLAASLGMKKTKFLSPHGLDNQGDITQSCAVDMALLSTYAMQRPGFAFIVKQTMRRIGIESPLGTTFFDVRNTNPLLSMSGVDGVKTAHSRLSGPCVIATVTRNAVSRFNPLIGQNSIYPQRLVVVVLGSQDRYELARKLMTAGWTAWDQWQAAGQKTDDVKSFLSLPKAPVKKTN